MTWASELGRALAPALVLHLAPGTATAQRPDSVWVGVEASGHVPGTARTLERGTESLALSELGPFVHEAAAAFGLGMSDLSSEVVVRIGYGFATGTLPAGSTINGAEVTGYSMSAVPIALGWRVVLGPWLIRFIAGIDLGGQLARMSYESPDRAQLGGGWSWCFGGRAIAGVHVDVWDFIGVRLYAEGRLSAGLAVEGAPDLGLNVFGFGLAVLAAPEELARAALGRPSEDGATPAATPGETLGDRGASEPAPEVGVRNMERASALIREADAARDRRDFIAAARLYAEGVRLLPLDAETRQNLEVPVRVDWARALIEVVRPDDAREVLEEALKVSPDDRAVRALLDELRGPTAPQ